MAGPAVGFYGKLPSHGDFLHRGLPDQLVNPWDAWLQDGIARSRRDLGEAWLDVFLTSPVWHFVFGSGVFGLPAWAGIVMPSVDRVGRYFPLTVAVELPSAAMPFDVAVSATRWFVAVEDLARAALDADVVDPARLERDLAATVPLLAGAARAAPDLAVFEHGDDDVWPLALAEDLDLGRFFAGIAHGLIAPAREPVGLWWSSGSARVAPTALMTRGLPAPSLYRDLLCGSGASWPDPFGGTQVRAGDGLVAATMPEMAPAHHAPYASAAITDTGRKRDDNQDTYVERSADGLWAVADGMGGHAGGATASRIVAGHLEAVEVGADPAARERVLAQALADANHDLRRYWQRIPGFDGGSTVVVLSLCGSEGLVLWAGDSRLYRLRDGLLVQVTRDHSVAEEGGDAFDEPGAITRAVGGAETFEPGVLRFEVRAGDRFLLCSDGVYGELTSQDLLECLGLADCAGAATALIGRALSRGGSDNATAVVVAVVGG